MSSIFYYWKPNDTKNKLGVDIMHVTDDLRPSCGLKIQDLLDRSLAIAWPSSRGIQHLGAIIDMTWRVVRIGRCFVIFPVDESPGMDWHGEYLQPRLGRKLLPNEVPGI